MSLLMVTAAPSAVECIRVNPLDRLGIMASAQVRHSLADLDHPLKILRLDQVHAAWADRDVIVVAVSPLDVVPDSPPVALEPPESPRCPALPFGALLPR